MDVIEAISTPPIHMDALHWSRGGDILTQSSQKCFIISPRPSVKGLGLVGCILFDVSQEDDVHTTSSVCIDKVEGESTWINAPQFIINSSWSPLGVAWDGGCAAALVSSSGCLSIHEPPLSGVENRWPISCKFGSVRCAEWMPSTLRSRCGNSIILVVGGVNGLELISLYKAHRKPLSLLHRQDTGVFPKEEIGKEEHIQMLDWCNNHVISRENGEISLRSTLLAAGTNNGKIILYHVQQAEGDGQFSAQILRCMSSATGPPPQALVIMSWSNALVPTDRQLVVVAVADVTTLTVHWLEVPSPSQLHQSSSLVLKTLYDPSSINTWKTSWKAHGLTISTVKLSPPSDDAGSGPLTVVSSSLDGMIKEWELTQPFYSTASGSFSTKPPAAPPDTYRTLLGGSGGGKELPILGFSWSPGQYFMAVMRLQPKSVGLSSFLKSFRILEKGHTRTYIHLAPREGVGGVDTLGRGGDGADERCQLLLEATWIHLFTGNNEPYLKTIEDNAFSSKASSEALRLKHTVVCSQGGGLGPSSKVALKLRWRLLRRWCEHCLDMSSPDHDLCDSNKSLMRQLVGKEGGGKDNEEASAKIPKEVCGACKLEMLPFHESEDRGDPLKARCPGNHVTRRCMRTLRICSDVTSLLTCPLCSSICLVAFPTMPCLFCEITLRE